MAVYIELTTDPFDDVSKQAASGATQAGAGLVSVRRPTRGLEIRDDTHAYIKLIRADGIELPLFDSSSQGGYSYANSNFILTNVAEQRMEKNQIVETFGDTYLYLFGESPRFLSVSAMLLDSLDFNWRSEFMANYETYLRGTKAVELGARTYLFYKDNIVEGFILNCSISDDANQPHLIPLQFQFFVTNSQNISLIGEGSDQYPVRSSAVIPEDLSLYDDLGGESLDILKGFGDVSDQTIQNADRKSPIRSLILDNTDEYTTQLQSDPLADRNNVYNAFADRYLQSVGGIHLSLSLVIGAYGVSNPFDPFLMNDMGYGPTFTNPGVGIGSFAGQSGSFATFGAVASSQAGAFAGGGVGIGAQHRMAGPLGVGAYNGYSAGQTTVKTFGATLGSDGLQTYSSTQTFQGQAYNPSVTARGGAFVNGVRAPAFAYQQGAAQSSRFAAANVRAAARGGGYANAGAYLGNAYGGMPYSGGSYAGAQGGSGGSVHVGGTVTAFSFVAAKGTLANQGLPPQQALAYQQPDFAFSKSYSWPSGS